MKDWLKATAADFTAVSALVGIVVGLLYGPLSYLVREPDRIQDYASPDGRYIATVRTESGLEFKSPLPLMRLGSSGGHPHPASDQPGKSVRRFRR